MRLPKWLRRRVRRNVPLAGRTTLGVGGLAAAWCEPRTVRELTGILKVFRETSAIFVMGAGSNLLLGDTRHDKIFVHLGSRAFTGLSVRGTTVTVGAGVRTGRLVSMLMSRDLGGYEFLAGIPGTIGGSLVMNAGARSVWDDAASYAEMKDIVVSVDVMDRGGRRLLLKKRDIVFSYRASSLKPFVVLGVTLALRREPRRDVAARIKAAMARRFGVQDWAHPSAGSFFKNPQAGPPAAVLIDRCGLKGLAVGGAEVSRKHANFIINTGRASAADILKLMEIIQKKVYNRFRVKLEPEVEIVL